VTLYKDAETDTPVLIAAKAEYAKLKSVSVTRIVARLRREF
jgi:hypothetical protein